MKILRDGKYNKNNEDLNAFTKRLKQLVQYMILLGNTNVQIKSIQTLLTQ